MADASERSSALRRWVQSLLHTHDTPERTALAIGVGVGIGFSPFLGFHILLGLAVAFIFRLNRVAVLAGVLANLPWVLALYYAAATALGAWLTGTTVPPEFLARLDAIWSLPSWFARLDGLRDLLAPLLLAYFLGSTIGAVVLGTAAYVLTLPVLRTIAHKQQ